MRAVEDRALWRSALLVVLALGAGCSASARTFEPALDLQLELDPGTRRLHGAALLRPAACEFQFVLHESLQVMAATADGKKVALTQSGTHGSLRMWQATLPRSGGRLRLEYGGMLPGLAQADERGVLQGLPPMAAPQGSYLPSGAAWYPQPPGMFSYRVALSVPGEQRALVAGRLVSEQLPPGASGRYRATFEFAQPADGIDLMAGPWQVRERTMRRADGGPLRLRTYFPRELDQLSDGYLQDVERYIALYSAAIGTYPFTEFSVVASPLPTGFGMPTLTYLGAEVLKLPFIRGVSLGHEVLHNWWGNGVAVDYAGGNWSEGLTTFMADYAYKERESAQAARDMRLGWLRDFAAMPAGSQQTLASFRSRTHGAAAAVGYGKSAMVFFMLRDAIGADAFERGIRAFWAGQRFKVASWNDLRMAFEHASGRALGGFFDQWLQRAGGPAVRIAQVHAAEDNGKTRLEVSIEQDEPAYALHLPLEIVYEDRSEIRWIELTRPHERAALELASTPVGIRLDPDLRVWRRLDREQLPPILRQWVISRAPRLANASRAGDVRAAGQALAQRLFEAAPQSIAPKELASGGEPVLLVGLHDEVDAALASAGLPARPAQLAARGSAQCWTIDRPGAAPVAVVSGRDTESLRALLRPLPHYGSQSWLVFEGSRLVDKGVWPATGKLVPVPRPR